MAEKVENRKGFTFVELLIAATMLLVLMVGVGSHLRGGTIVWRRNRQTLDWLQRERVALGRFERDLANAIIYADGREDEELQLPAMEFGNSNLRWITVEPSARPGQLDAVRFVTYECKVLDETVGLWRTSQPLGEVREAGIEQTPKLLLPDCEAMRVYYAFESAEEGTTFEWHDEEWQDAENLPRLIKLEFDLTSGRTISCVMAIASGVLGSEVEEV